MPDLKQYQGLVLIGVMATITLWLAATGQLELYISPRHTIFAVTMSAVGLIAVTISAMHVSPGPPRAVRRRVPRFLSGAATALTALVTAAMTLLPPATLTSATATQRDINSTIVPADESTLLTDTAPDAAAANLSLADWASLLRQSTDLAFYDGKTVRATGLITPDPDDPDNVFYVSRFYVTHCTIDAQPVGVPVYLPDWNSTYDADQWVELIGTFEANGSLSSSQAIAVAAQTIDTVDEPSDPYIYR